MSIIIAPTHPTPLMQHQNLVLNRVNVGIPPHPPTPPHVSAASTSCERSRERGRKNINIPTPPYVSVTSTSCERSRERGRCNINIQPHHTPCERSINILRKVEGTCSKEFEHPHPTQPHESVASTSCAWSREHNRGNVNIPNPPHSTLPHPFTCKLWGKIERTWSKQY